MEAVRSVALAVVLSASAPGVHAAEWQALPTVDTQDGFLSFHTLGSLCGFGEDAYYGYIGGDVTLKKVFVEIMGGAVCFNKKSCQDDWFGAWMSITRYLTEKNNVPLEQVQVFKSGVALPLQAMMSPVKPGYFPIFKSDDAHTMRHWPGIYFPTCTGDIMGGRHNLTYTDGEGDDMTALHYGAINLNKVLEGMKVVWPALEEITIVGGSGGAVTASVWMSRVAEIWPNAKVNALIDSGFHMFPGSDFFKFFYNNIRWSNGPGGDNDDRVPGVTMPKWNWLEKDAIVRDLEDAKGRLRVAYIACNRDHIVFSDRDKMSSYSTFEGSTINQTTEMWDFLTNLHKCAPAQTAYSYIMDCAGHHLTQGGYGDTISASHILDGQPSMKVFVDNFLAGKPPSSSAVDKTAFWFENEESIDDRGGLCPGETAPSPAAPSPAAPSPTAPSPTAPSPTGPSPTGPSPTGPSPTAPSPTMEVNGSWRGNGLHVVSLIITTVLTWITLV